MINSRVQRLRGLFPKKQTFVFMSRAYDVPDYELVGRLFVEVLELGVADFISYDAPHEDPVAERPEWFGDDPSYNGVPRDQTEEQIVWLSANVARLIGADLRTLGSDGPYLNFGIADQNTLYIEVSEGSEEHIQALPTYKELGSRKMWEISRDRGFRFFR